MKEIWKDVVNYEGLYEVSNLGSIKSKGRTVSDINGRVLKYPEKILKQSNSNGYMVVQLSDINKSKRSLKVHRLVAEAFIDNPLKLPVVNHINGVKSDNRLENLEWCTDKENTLHAHKTGLAPHSKKVAQINKDSGEIIGIFNSISEASERTGIQRPHIGAVCNGKPNYRTAGGYAWRFVDKEEYEKSFNRKINKDMDKMFTFMI